MLILASSILLFAHAVFGQERNEKLEQFLRVAEELREDCAIPGVGLAIVQDNEIIYTGGLGFSNLEEQTRVSENTLFSIGSNTKPFTGLLATKLVSRGQLDWDRPLIHYIPELRLKENYINEHVTIADALAHRVGLKQSSSLWKYKSLTRKELMAMLVEIDFDTEFRMGFNYNNLMYMVAGVTAERVTEKTWEDLIVQEIFQPLGMEDSLATSEEFMESPKRAIGYHNDGIRPAPPVDLTSIAPAGAISSTPKDIANWILMFVDRGHHQGEAFLTPEEYDHMLRPHSNLSIRNEDELWYYYTGWGGFMKDGKRTLGASGAIDGQNSRCVMLLDDGFGIFIMTNKVSDYKDLMTQYAKQIFVEGKLTRDQAKEMELAERAGFDRWLTRLLDEGEEAAATEYDQLKVKPSETHVNQLGYDLMSQGEMDKAVFALKTNVRSFPNSANAHDSLGEVYSKTGQWELASTHYQRSLELDSDNENARKMLLEIQEMIK